MNTAAKVITGEVEIEAPSEKVWTLLTSHDEIITWYDECDNITRHSPQATLQVGSTFQLTRGGVSTWCRVTLMESCRQLGWIEETAGTPTVFVAFRLEPLGHERTRLVHTKTLAE